MRNFSKTFIHFGLDRLQRHLDTFGAEDVAESVVDTGVKLIEISRFTVLASTSAIIFALGLSALLDGWGVSLLNPAEVGSMKVLPMAIGFTLVAVARVLLNLVQKSYNRINKYDQVELEHSSDFWQEVNRQKDLFKQSGIRRLGTSIMMVICVLMLIALGRFGLLNFMSMSLPEIFTWQGAMLVIMTSLLTETMARFPNAFSDVEKRHLIQRSIDKIMKWGLLPAAFSMILIFAIGLPFSLLS